MLEEGTAVGTNMREANKNVAKDSKLGQEPLQSKSKSHGVIWASGGDEYDENYDVYEHLDKVPITMPPSLGPQDYMYNPYRCNVIFNASQDSTNLQTVSSQNSLLEQENQQLKETLSQLQSEYSDLQELHENLDGKYQEALEYGADATIQMEDQAEEIAQLKDQVVNLLENCKKITEHDNEICDKYNSLSIEFNTFLPQIKLANSTNLDLQKKVKGLQYDNYLLNKALEKISPESDLNKRLNSSIESEESEDTSIHYHQDSASQTNFNSLNSTISSSTTGTDCSVQTSPTQNNRDFSTQTKAVSHQKSPSPTKKTKSPSSKTTPPQSNTLVNPGNITTNFKSFKCAWCSEKKHEWTQCNQWNKWNLGQKQQALQILDNAKRGKLPSTVSKRPHFHPQQKLPANPTKVRGNRESFSRVQWEKQMKINENVKDAGLVKISSSFYVPQCSAVKQGVKSSSLRRGRTTPKSK